MSVFSLLLVEDDVSLQDVYKQALEESGYSVKLAANGDDALRLLKSERVDVIVSDIFMPEKEGMELLSILRKEYPSIPTIMYTGGLKGKPTNILNMAKHLGAEDVLVKPFALGELVAAVNGVMSKKKSC